MVQQANALNLRLVIVLVNNWRDFGGMDQYVRWRGLTFHDQFYTDPTIRGWYQNFVRTLLNRTNSLTGVQYKNDPGIFGWELANEPRCVGSGTSAGGFPNSPNCDPGHNTAANASIITEWVNTLSAFVKSQDPNHLVGVSDEGFLCIPGSSDFVQKVTVIQSGNDVGVAAAYAKTLMYYAASPSTPPATAAAARDLAKGLLNIMRANFQDNLGVALPETGADYKRFNDPVFIPSGWTGVNAQGAALNGSTTFSSMRLGYADPSIVPAADWAKVQAYLAGGPAPTFTYRSLTNFIKT